MQEVVTDPFFFFLSSILFGMGLIFCYDILRTIRNVFHHNNITVIIEDLLFAIFTAVTSFLFLCTYNHGELRGFFFLGIFLGMSSYHMIVSKRVCKILCCILVILKQCFEIFSRTVTNPVICIWRNVKWRLKKEKKQVTMALKRQTKRGDRSGTKEKSK